MQANSVQLISLNFNILFDYFFDLFIKIVDETFLVDLFKAFFDQSFYRKVRLG